MNIKLEGYGEFESYPNRDSMKYVDAYGLKGVKTIYRGTLRRPPFCKGWNVLVQMGFTNRKEVETDTFRGQVERLVKDKKVVPDEETEGLLRELGVVPMLLSHKEPRLVPADFLQQVLERSWSLQPGDKDMIVMIHQIEFSDKSGKEKQTMESSLVVKGKDSDHTAMSLTVGLPMAMVTEMILNNEIKRTGVLMPRYPEIYNPILARLEKHGINFKEKII
ncbi:MAG: hypothetical protein IPP77_02080 [Bacteroidetes bacterium]|nr:hypothetical protein [Bacteroidota bacterium]